MHAIPLSSPMMQPPLPISDRTQPRHVMALRSEVSSYPISVETHMSGMPSLVVERGPDGVEQGIAVERFFEERDGSGL
jgi:hypothetical protein